MRKIYKISFNDFQEAVMSNPLLQQPRKLLDQVNQLQQLLLQLLQEVEVQYKVSKNNIQRIEVLEEKLWSYFS